MEKNTREKYDELCRLCASYDAVKMDVFGQEGKNRQLVDKIQTCLPFKIAEDDRLPKCLCYRCMYNLENFYDFRTACINAVALLERCLPDEEAEKKEEPEGEEYSELRMELLKEKDHMPNLIPEAPVVNPNAALGTPPRLKSDGEDADPENEDGGELMSEGEEVGLVDERKTDDEYEMDMETNPSDFLEMTSLVPGDDSAANSGVYRHRNEQHEVYVCSLCNKAFSSKGHLSLHARIHVGAGDVIGEKVITDDHTSFKRPYQCDLCNKSYSTAKHRWGHVSTTHRGHPAVTCAYCSRIYSTRTNLDEHVKSRHAGMPAPPEATFIKTEPSKHRCKTCPKMYASISDLNKHSKKCTGHKKAELGNNVHMQSIARVKATNDMSDISSIDSDYEPNKDYRSAEAKLIKNPNLTILKQALIKGEGAKKEYEERQKMLSKTKKVQKVGELDMKRWYCESCPQNFATQDELRNHELVHDAEKPFICILCEKDFALKSSLSRHIMSSHGVDPTPIIESDKCLKKTVKAMNLGETQIKQEQDVDKDESPLSSENLEIDDEEPENGLPNNPEMETVFVCEICTRDFSDRASLWLHIRATHKEYAAFACGICLKICQDNEQLLNHVNMYHGGSKLSASEQRRYSCAICGRQHDSRKKLMNHVSIHNIDPQYDPASFVQLNSSFYNETVNSNHDGTDQLIMDCDPEDGEKVDCYICNKSFPNEDQLIRHQRNAHKDHLVVMNENGNGLGGAQSANGNRAQYHLYFVCELCGSSHPSKWERWLHVSSVHPDEPSIKCDKEECAKIFATKSLRTEHVQHHVLQGGAPNTCEICGKLWGSRVDYWKHVMGVHSDTVPLICGVCLKVFPDVHQLSAHVRERHWPLTNGDFSCDICGRPYSNKSKMSRHRRIHGLDNVAYVNPSTGRASDDSPGGINHDQMVFPPNHLLLGDDDHRQHRSPVPANVDLGCEMCGGAKFANLEELGNHRRQAHNLFPCDLCNKFYGRTSHLWKHVNRVHKGHKDVTCRYCSKTSASRDHLAAHIAKIHRYEPEVKDNLMAMENYKNPSTSLQMEQQQNAAEEDGVLHFCEKCNKSFHKRYLLRRHMKGCQNYRKDPGALLTRCRACERIFKDRASLQKHLENHHRSYECHLCKETVTSKINIMTHNRVNHMNHPDLTCEFENCKKLLRTKEDLDHHRQLHKYSTPNVCDFCGDTVDNKLKLKMHVLSLHRNEIGVSCGVCLIPMKDPKDLKKHVEDVHASVLLRPNTCQVCGKKYASKWKAFDHTKKCHGKVFRTCKQCLAVFTQDSELRDHYEIIHKVPKNQLDAFQYRLDAVGSKQDDNSYDSMEISVKEELEDYDDPHHQQGKKRPAPNLATYDCDICHEIFLNQDTLTEHCRNVHNTDASRMLKKMRMDEDDDEDSSDKVKKKGMRERENYECKNCQKQFCTKTLFWGHVNVCTRRPQTSILESHLKGNNQQQQVVKCEQFDEDEGETSLNIPDFNLFEDLTMQLTGQKPVPSLMPLGGGGSKAGGKYSRKDSRKVYDESTNTECTCEVCGKPWPAKKHLWQHLIRFHRAEAAVTCGVCLKLCTTYDDLAEHLKNIHPSILFSAGNNFTCKVCGRYHNARSKLFLHMSIHINCNTNFMCQRCHRTFESDEALKEHIVTCADGQTTQDFLKEEKVDLDEDEDDEEEEEDDVEKGSLIGDEEEEAEGQVQPEEEGVETKSSSSDSDSDSDSSNSSSDDSDSGSDDSDEEGETNVSTVKKEEEYESEDEQYREEAALLNYSDEEEDPPMLSPVMPSITKQSEEKLQPIKVKSENSDSSSNEGDTEPEENSEVEEAEEEDENSQSTTEEKAAEAPEEGELQNLNGTVLMLAKDGEGNQILIERDMADLGSDDQDMTEFVFQDENGYALEDYEQMGVGEVEEEVEAE